MLRCLKNKRGFTIVELLLAIVVIGILSTLVSVGYQAYIRKVEDTRTATTVSAYQQAVGATTAERQLVPDNYSEAFGWTFTCLSTTNDNTPCCFLYTVQESNATPGYGCGDNTFHGSGASRWGGSTLSPGFPIGYSASQLSSWVKQHLPNSLPPPLIPASKTPSPCSSAITLNGGGLGCITNEIGLEVRIEDDLSTKKFLHYMLPPDRDCQSRDVVTATDSPPGLRYISAGQNIYYPYGVTYTNAKYTFRHTAGGSIKPFTFCVVGIK